MIMDKSSFKHIATIINFVYFKYSAKRAKLALGSSVSPLHTYHIFLLISIILLGAASARFINSRLTALPCDAVGVERPNLKFFAIFSRVVSDQKENKTPKSTRS